MQRILSLILLPALVMAAAATPAHAGPVFAAIGTFVTSAVATITASGFLSGIVGRLLVSIAGSLLLQALAPKPRPPGIRTEVTQTGGTNPQTFVLMTYATAGYRVCPPMSHGRAGDTQNAYLTEVIEVGDIAGQALSRLIINDEYVTLGTTPHPEGYGLPVLGTFNNRAWIKYYDGTQTVADPMLLAKYGTYPERPWSADMIGRGVCYAILTCRFRADFWNATPRFRFEVAGIPLYDPRKDSTVGGSGTHRWAVKSTWQPTTNPIVGIYNILRGIELADGSVWGGGFPAADLPLASWFAAMNECDMLVPNGVSGTEPQYRAGFEIAVNEEPADIIAELLKACSGQISEVGGFWKIRVGAPGLAVATITDGDIITSTSQGFTPFPGFTSSFNGVHGTYPEPAQLWERKEATPLYNATWEAQDQGQRLVADLGLPAVPYGAQVRRLMEAYIAEERRFRRHGQTLPPDYAVLEPLDALSWTSTANGYVSKVFEVSEVVDDLMTCLQQVALRERDAGDYVGTNPAPPTVVSPVVVIPATQFVTDFAVVGTSIQDALGANRRPALRLNWEPDLDDVSAILWEVRLQATGVVVAQGSTQNVAAGTLLVTGGILGSTAYQARAYPVVQRPADWTAWLSATTPATLITGPDIAAGAVTEEVVDDEPAVRLFNTMPTGTLLAEITLPAPSEPWIISAVFDIRRTTAGTFTVALQERRVRTPLISAFTTLHSWPITTDGEPGNVIDWWSRWHSVTRGGIFGTRQYRLIVLDNSGSPVGEIRSVRLIATRITK